MRKHTFRFLLGMIIGLSALSEDVEAVAGATDHQAEVLLGKMFDGEDVADALRPHAAEVIDILAQTSFKAMTRIWLAELAAGDEAQQARAARSLVSLGNQAASEVRAFRDAHAGDTALAARCDQVLAEQKDVTAPAAAPNFPPKPLLRFLLQLPDLPVEKILPLESFYRAALYPGREGRLRLDDLTPETLETLLRQTAAMPNAGKHTQSWMAGESAETFRKLAEPLLTERFENAFPLLLTCQHHMQELLRILASPNLAGHLDEAKWKMLIEAMAESTVGTDVFLAVLDGLAEVPPGFSANAHILMQARNVRHVALGGLFQTRYAPPGSESRELLRSLIRDKVPNRGWGDFLKKHPVDPRDALYLLSVYAWRVGGFENPTVIHLLDQTDALYDAELLSFLADMKTNHILLTLYAIRRPLLQKQIGTMIFQGVKEEFTQSSYHHAGNCMQSFKDLECPPGLFDDEWLALYEKHDENPNFRNNSLFILFIHAPRYRITPELLWEKYRIHEEELMASNPSFMKRLPVYMMEYGGPELRKELVSRLLAPAGEASEAEKAKRPDFKSTLALDPAEIEGLLALQARLFFEQSRENKGAGFPYSLFSTSFASSRYKDTADFHRQNREGIAAALKDKTLRPALLPLLAVCGMENDLRREDRDFLRDAIRTCVEAYPEPDGVLLGGSFVAALLGIDDDVVVRAFSESLAIPGHRYSSHWRILVSLNGDHAFLLPGLFRMADREQVSMYPLLAMIQIAPRHPEVVRRVQHILHEGDDHALACQVVEYLTWTNAAPGLDAFSGDRIDWFLRLDTDESLYNTARFVNAFPAGDQGPIVERLRPRLKEVAQGRDIFFTFHTLFSTEEWQRQVAEDVFALLASDDPKEFRYAVNELSGFHFFTPRQLRLLATQINRFEHHQNAMNIRPRLMAAICNAGRDAAFLLREIRHHATNGDEHLRPVALRCLAGITDDPAEGQACFDKLVWAYRNERSWRSSQVRQISRLRGRPENVIPFLKDIILAYGSQGGPEDRSVQEALWGLPFQTSSSEVVIPLFQHIWKVGCRSPGHNDVLEAMMYTVAHDYPVWIPHFIHLMEETPLRHRVYYGYRKMALWLKKAQPSFGEK